MRNRLRCRASRGATTSPDGLSNESNNGVRPRSATIKPGRLVLLPSRLISLPIMARPSALRAPSSKHYSPTGAHISPPSFTSISPFLPSSLPPRLRRDRSAYSVSERVPSISSPSPGHILSSLAKEAAVHVRSLLSRRVPRSRCTNPGHPSVCRGFGISPGSFPGLASSTAFLFRSPRWRRGNLNSAGVCVRRETRRPSDGDRRKRQDGRASGDGCRAVFPTHAVACSGA